MMDLAGKAYGAPAYQLAGGKFRDEVRIYCDTHARGAEEMGQELKERMERGFTFLKIDHLLLLRPVAFNNGMVNYRNNPIEDPLNQTVTGFKVFF